jgi:hypothetical protein
MFIITTVIAVVCGWLGSKLEKKRREREAIKAIERVHGEAYYDYQTCSDGEPYGPRRLRSVLGNNFFSDITVVRMVPTDDGAIESVKDVLQDLPHLKELQISASFLSDRSMRYIADLKPLETLELSDVQATDAGLLSLKGLMALRHLELGGHFSDAAIADLQQTLPDCKIIR